MDLCERCLDKKELKTTRVVVSHNKAILPLTQIPLYSFNMRLCKRCRQDWKNKLDSLKKRFLSEGD